jgi:hypothetical protein
MGRVSIRDQRTQPPPTENIRALLDRREAYRLLANLCEQAGFCLAPDEQNRIASSPPTTVDGFANAALIAEGLDPLTSDRRSLRGVRRLVAEAFATHVKRDAGKT